MIQFAYKEYREMSERLQQIAIETEDILQRAEQSFHSVQFSLQKLKEQVLDYHFNNEDEEIHFFKEVKPQFLRELIYHIEVYYIEASRPVSDKDADLLYFKQETERIRIYFERNQMLYNYYRTGKTIYDSSFFLREADPLPLVPEYLLDLDPRFSTLQSFKLSKLQAFEMVNRYLQQASYKLLHPDVSFADNQKKSHTHWTDTKAALIELAYALHANGSVNNGKGDVKQIVSDLEMLFNIQVGNFYRTFQSMRIRKTKRTPHLDNLKGSLERRMDDADLNYP